MADLKVEGNELVLELSAWEKAETLNRDVRVPLSSVRGVEVLEDAHGAIGWRGFKTPGTRIPGVVEAGTFRIKGKRIFAVVHHDTPRGVRVRLEGTNFDELVVGGADPEAVAATLQPVP